MTNYNYVISNYVHKNIYNFYTNVSKKYNYTYSDELMYKNINDAYDSIYKIENCLLRRKPTLSRWNGMFMATAGKWYFAYRIDGDTIYVEDACHAQNMHEERLREKIRSIIIETINNMKVHNGVLTFD